MRTAKIDTRLFQVRSRRPAGDMKQSVSAKRLLMLMSVFLNSFWCQPQIAEARPPATESVRGAVFVADQDGGRSVVPGAIVSLHGSVFSQQTVSDESVKYNFAAVVPIWR
jgi:hypothetical protein